MNSKLLALLSETDLFSAVSEKLLSEILTEENSRKLCFKGGEVIYSAENFKDSIAVVVSGSAKVIKKDSDVLVGKLFEGDIFGAQSLFLGKEFFMNEIVAETETEVFFIDKPAVISLMENEPMFSYEYIRYLSGRIFYLNRKIGNFTGGTAESRLAAYLLNAFGDYKTFKLEMPLSQLAVYLDIGRASLYRAFDSIIAAKAIEKEGKKFRLLNKEELIGFIK